VIIGGAFGKIVESLVKDVIMPPIGLLLGGVDFNHLYINLGSGTYESLEAAEKAGAPLIKYGAFINTAVDFLIVAFAIFVAIKAINKLKRAQSPAPPAPAAPPEDILLLREIRDALRK
jgi:large conductance mechanosensitive channel